MAYVMAKTTQLFVCQATLFDLGILPQWFPNHKSVINQVNGTMPSMVSQLVGPKLLSQLTGGDESHLEV